MHERGIMRPSTQFAAAAVLGAACLVSLPTANAQGQMQHKQTQSSQSQSGQAQPSQTQPNQMQSDSQGQSAHPDIPDDKLNAVAAAIPHVASIKQDYQKRIETAPANTQQRMIGEATAARTKAVTDEGLSVDEYSAILEVARNDPSVRQEITQRMHASGE